MAAMTVHEIVAGGEAVCHAEPGAECRTGCPAGECEEWGGDECSHGPLVDMCKCFAAEWLTAATLDGTCFADDGSVPEDFVGPIEIVWTGDSYVWEPSRED